MNRISHYGLLLLVVAPLAATPAAWAACNLDTQIVGHTLGGSIINCPDLAPLRGHIWLLATPGSVNSNGQNFLCRHEGEVIPDSGVDCTFAPGSGIDGDGVVTVYMEWGIQNSGAVGCPNQAQAGNGTTPIGVQVSCSNSSSAMFQLGFSEDFQQFPLEYAAPTADPAVSANYFNIPQVRSISAGPTPSGNTICLNVPLPTFHSDCDPGTLSGGPGGLTCPNPATRPTPERGVLMSSNGPCAAQPDLRVTGGPTTWTPMAVQPDANGDACNVFDCPLGQCLFIGVEGRFGGQSAGAIVGYVSTCHSIAVNDKVRIDDALAAQGRVKVAFSTINETSIVGFNVYSDRAKLNGSLIVSAGPGNNAYQFEIGRGALKGGKSVFVEVVKNDGTVEKTAPVSLK